VGAPTLLQVEQLKKYFPITRGTVVPYNVGQVRAVDDISFSIAAGETFAIVGESGCGKTTMARTILRLETAATYAHQSAWDESYSTESRACWYSERILSPPLLCQSFTS
jgi:ABC-type glutathione transport system ATPase component